MVASGGGFPGGAATGRAPGGAGSVSRALASLLEQGSSRYTWVAASASAQNAASLELSTGKPVMAIGGFSGNDPSTTLARFEQLVAAGKIHYYVSGGRFGGGAGGARGGAFPGGGPPPGGPPPGGGGPPAGVLPGGRPPAGGFPGGPARPGGGNSANSVERQIQSWVTSHFKSTTVGGTTVYNLTQRKAS